MGVFDSMRGEIEVKVYYEDTDALGVVYYANYMRYYERGRTECLAQLGKPIQSWNAEGFNFAVFKASLTYHKPARLGDICSVVTEMRLKSPFRMQVFQRIYRSEELVNEAEVVLVCLDRDLELREFPEEVDV